MLKEMEDKVRSLVEVTHENAAYTTTGKIDPLPSVRVEELGKHHKNQNKGWKYAYIFSR